MARRDPNYIDVHVGSRIRMRRQLINMSQERLGELLGITFQQVQKYEKGANRISASRLFYTAKTLGVPINFFFEGLPGIEGETGLKEPGSPDEFMANMMTPEGIQLAKAFRGADTATKRKLIAAMARMIVELDE
jgi:transcriptional regulator with XRE-family HTH domain